MSDRHGHREGATTDRHGQRDGSAPGSAPGSATDARGSGFFGASSHRSPFAAAAVAALHGDDASGSASGSTGGSAAPSHWGASTKDRRPPREMLYVRKAVALADFARDFADGTVAGYAKLPAEDKRRRFGSSIVPIFVPLAPGESEAQYEARFAAWVQRTLRRTVQELEKDDDENLERFYRMRFACANARGTEKFQENKKHDHKHDGARTDDHQESYSHSNSRSSSSQRHRSRSQSPARSISSSRSHETSRSDRDRTSRHHDSSERDDRRDRHHNSSERNDRRDRRHDSSERDDRRDRRRASLSPARSVSSSSGGSHAQRFGRHPSTGKRVPREALYAKKYVELDQYKIDFSHFKIVGYTKLPENELIKLFNSTIIPIHVPLARGESIQQYEDRFAKWLKKQGYTLRDVETHSDAAFERVMRIKFANLNAQGEEKFVAPDAKRERPTTESSPRPTKKPAREETSSAPTTATNETSSRTTTSSASSSREKTATSTSPSAGSSSKTETKSPSSSSAKATPNGSAAGRECSFNKPPEGALTSAIAAAYIACGCRQCLVTGMRFLSGKVNELGAKTCSTCTKKPVDSSSAPSRGVVDLTQDDDPHSPRRKSSRFAAAITKLVTSRSTLDELQQQLGTTSNKPHAEGVSDDPVEQHLLREYEKINQEVILHEKNLGDLAARIASTPITDIAETTRLQDKSDALREVIQSKTNDRSAALAMVVVHVWRHKKRELEQHVGDDQTKNVLHIQRTSHEKCSTLSAAIKNKRQNIAAIKKRLDTAMATTSTNGNNLIASLGRLGQDLTKAEHELHDLWRQRRQKFTTLMEYDQSLRVLIKTLLHSSS